MKNSQLSFKLLILIIAIVYCSTNIQSYGQVSVLSHNPTGGAYLGWNAGQNLELRTNNLTHMQMMQTGSTTINGFPIDYDGFVGISQDPILFTSGIGSPFSLLHLNGDNGGGALTNGYRDWMRYGLTYTHNRDMMYVGQREMGDYDITDAVIAWADNSGESNGPDNLCFVFTAGNGTNTTPTDPQHILGRETARMTGIGHTGIGIRWTNALQPKRTLDVVRHESVPQFRITRQNDVLETGGIYTDFETSGLGHLHILPRDEVTKNVGIGFLSVTSTPTERIDVYAGTARLRQVPDNAPHVIITGVKQDVSPTDGDYVLNYLSFPQDNEVVLAGDGTWISMEAADCDWEVIENVTGIMDVVTGHGNDCYPAGHAGVGVTVPEAKLHVYHEQTQVNPKPQAGLFRWDESTEETFPIAHGLKVELRRGDIEGTMGYGIHTRAYGSQRNWGGYFEAQAGSVTGANIGVHGEAFGLAASTVPSSNYGGYFQAGTTSNANSISLGVFANGSNGQISYGVQCQANNGTSLNYGLHSQAVASSSVASPTENIGVFGQAYAHAGVTTNMGVAGYAINGANNYAIYGQAPTGSGNWAGYFNGGFTSSGTFFLVSDEQFKTNVEDFETGLDVINQLSPKTYEFLHEQYPTMSFSEGTQYGLIAQELAEVLPELVGTVVAPTLLDSLGNEISSAIEYQAVNYIGLVPILISAVKEQQSQIEEQDESIAQLQESLNNQNEVLAQMMEQLANMQQQINQCCNANDGTKSLPGGTFQPQDLNNDKNSEGGNELYQNIPNPFRESTTISYQLEFGGRVQLSIYDGNGKVVTTLVEANQPNGRHSTMWNANGMPAGVYHYALYVDGELLVKRAIKLQE